MYKFSNIQASSSSVSLQVLYQFLVNLYSDSSTEWLRSELLIKFPSPFSVEAPEPLIKPLIVEIHLAELKQLQ